MKRIITLTIAALLSGSPACTAAPKAKRAAPKRAAAPLPCHREGCGPAKTDPCACHAVAGGPDACFPTWEACMSDAGKGGTQ